MSSSRAAGRRSASDSGLFAPRLSVIRSTRCGRPDLAVPSRSSTPGGAPSSLAQPDSPSGYHRIGAQGPRSSQIHAETSTSRRSRAVPSSPGAPPFRSLPAVDQAAAEVRLLPAVRVFEVGGCVLITNKIVPIELASLIVFEDRALPASARQRDGTQDHGQRRAHAPASRRPGRVGRRGGAEGRLIGSDGEGSSHARSVPRPVSSRGTPIRRREKDGPGINATGPSHTSVRFSGLVSFTVPRSGAQTPRGQSRDRISPDRWASRAGRRRRETPRPATRTRAAPGTSRRTPRLTG